MRGLSMLRTIKRFSGRVLCSVAHQRRECVTFVESELAKKLELKLMSKDGGFTAQQLMELAGGSVAAASLNFASHIVDEGNIGMREVLVLCGPGKSGGNALVTARHLSHFGLNPTVVYPKGDTDPSLYGLRQQLVNLDIPVLDCLPSDEEMGKFSIAIDSMLGIALRGPPQEPYQSIIQDLVRSRVPVISVDVPSGRDVEEGDIYHTNFLPAAVVSIAVPKKCTQHFRGVHYLGGRFVPSKLARELGITLPDYGNNAEQFLVLSGEYSVGADHPRKVAMEVGTFDPITGSIVKPSHPLHAQRTTQAYAIQGTDEGCFV